MIEYIDYGTDDLEFEDEVEYPAIVDNDAPVDVLAPPVVALADERSAEERIADLFAHLPGGHDELMAVLEVCIESTPEEQVMTAVAAVQERRHSVYSALSLCRMLERAGALVHLREDGSPYDEASLQPKHVVEDGVEYIVAAEPPASYWACTKAGLACVEADDPLARTRSLIAEDAAYASIYRYILERCLAGSVSGKELGSVIDKLPQVQSPRLYGTFFIKRLEDAGAIVWDDAWRMSDKMPRELDWLGDVNPLDLQ